VLRVVGDAEHEALDLGQDVRGVEGLTGSPPAFLLAIGVVVDVEIRWVGQT
jgi:hypothetical protein